MHRRGWTVFNLFIATTIALSGCTSYSPEYVLFDERSSSNVKYTIRSDHFPEEHWAYTHVRDSGLKEVVVIISEHQGEQSIEQVCEPDGAFHYLIAEKVYESGIYQRVRFWNARSRESSK